MTCFLGIDVGTSSLKAGLWHVDGRLIAHASQAFVTHRPAPTWAEQNPLDWWNALRAAVQQILNESQITPAEIVGIGIDSTGWTFVPVDAAGEPIHAALLWQDRRAQAEAAALRQHPAAQQIVGLAANPLDEGYATAKVRWLRDHRPEVYRQIDQLMSSSGFLVRRLTGRSVCDYSQAYAFHCFDVANGRWDETAADALGIELDALPPLVASTDIVGDVTAAAAVDLGLAAGTPVIAGGMDAAVAALGGGVARAGETADQGGTAFGMSIAVDSVIVEPRLIFSPHVVPGLYLLQGGTVGGGTFDWFRRQLGQAEEIAAALLDDDVFSLLTAEAQRSPIGANGLIFLPYMSGERSPIWNSDARGVFFGLNYGTTRADLIRAVMEGCVFAVYHNMHVAEDAGGHINEWIGTGGAANSPTWCQLKADITNRPFTITRQASGESGDNTLGLAVMTGYALGHYPDLAETITQFLPHRQTYTPNPANHAIYRDLYPIFRDLYERLVPNFEAIAAFSHKYKDLPE